MADEIDDYKRQYDDDQFRIRQAPRSILSRRSTVVREEVQDPETGEWRTKIRFSRRVFNEREKGIFLNEYQKWGRMGESAAAAGVSPQTVRKAMEEDEDFANAVWLCEEAYRDKLIGHHQDLVFNGTEKVNYDRNGNIVSRETVYPVRLIELELKKHDKGYRDRQEVDITHKGGVLIAPAEVGSIDDWEKRFAQAKDVTTPGPLLDSSSISSSSPTARPSYDDEDDPF